MECRNNAGALWLHKYARHDERGPNIAEHGRVVRHPYGEVRENLAIGIERMRPIKGRGTLIMLRIVFLGRRHIA